MHRRRQLVTVALAAALLLVVPAVAQCPMCRTALESPEAAGLARAFNRGILFLLAVPFAAVAVVAVLVVRGATRARAAADATPRVGP